MILRNSSHSHDSDPDPARPGDAAEAPAGFAALLGPRIKSARWLRFTWQLAALPPAPEGLEAYYKLRAASHEEAESVEKVISSSYSLDSDWGDHYASIRERLQRQILLAFERESMPAIVVLHGQRIIGASVLCTETGSDSHLISGPCVLSEYRNRGLGTALLHQSLQQLAQAGLHEANAIAKANSQAAKFVYTKFGADQAPWEPSASAAAAS